MYVSGITETLAIVDKIQELNLNVGRGCGTKDVPDNLVPLPQLGLAP